MKSRFKRFGSAKVLKNLYRKHRLESGVCFDILGMPTVGHVGAFAGLVGQKDTLLGGPVHYGKLTWDRKSALNIWF